MFRTSNYFPTSDEWFGTSSQKLEYSVNLFLCVEEWLPSVALVGLQRLVGCVLTKQLRLVAKQLEKGNSIVLRHYSNTNETSTKSIENLTSTAEFIELHAQIVQPVIKVRRVKEFLFLLVQWIFRAHKNLT